MKKIFFVSILSAILGVSFVSCDKDEASDTVKPVITLGAPKNGAELLIGADVHFEADFSDDVMLGSYLIEIHSNFENHTHKAPATRAGKAEKPFFFKKSYSLSGKRNAHVHHHDIVIPANATAGKYHLMIYCTDAAGNQSLVARDIVLSHHAEKHDHDGHKHHE